MARQRMTTVNRITVESSMVRSVGWRNGFLEVEFTRSGEIYRYEGVPRRVYYYLLRRAKSKGKYLRKRIINHYPTWLAR